MGRSTLRCSQEDGTSSARRGCRACSVASLLASRCTSPASLVPACSSGVILTPTVRPHSTQLSVRHSGRLSPASMDFPCPLLLSPLRRFLRASHVWSSAWRAQHRSSRRSSGSARATASRSRSGKRQNVSGSWMKRSRCPDACAKAQLAQALVGASGPPPNQLRLLGVRFLASDLRRAFDMRPPLAREIPSGIAPRPVSKRGKRPLSLINHTFKFQL
mmetsp:Transcript_3848/g.8340  ORF Transcript_3848/g.8340 Transcript_3848/m.8340 type:complete len:217 (-) Transcript_3848:55-705(-)